MRILVVGAGALGGFFGGRLAHAGEDVVFLARGEHLEALRTEGLRIDSPMGDLHLRPVQVTDDPGAIGRADLILFCVKTWQLRDAARAIKPALGPGAFAVPMQNGVEATGDLKAVLGEEKVLGGTCKVMCTLIEPGHVAHRGLDPVIAIGETDGAISDRVKTFRDLFARARVTVETPRDIQVTLWEKFLIIAPASGVGALARVPVGVYRSVPETRALLEQAMNEVVAVARARGIALPDDAVQKTLSFLDTLPPAGTSSIQRDLMEGRPSELDALNGAVMRLGRESGVPTPLNTFIYSCLRPMEIDARRKRGLPIQ